MCLRAFDQDTRFHKINSTYYKDLEDGNLSLDFKQRKINIWGSSVSRNKSHSNFCFAFASILFYVTDDCWNTFNSIFFNLARLQAIIYKRNTLNSWLICEFFKTHNFSSLGNLIVAIVSQRILIFFFNKLSI
jgi:hypothetical protein